MKVAVLMNAGAGSIGAARCEEMSKKISEAFAAANIEVKIHRCEPKDLVRSAREASSYAVDAVVAAGGDGTVSAVASGLVGTAMPMAVLPLGTLNHFARDLKMPNDLVEAAKAIAAGRAMPIDVAEVNGRVFVNNSSIGLYADALAKREVEQKTKGRGKWTAMFLAALRVLRAFPLLRLTLTLPDRRLTARTPIAFIGNNEYTVEPRHLGERAHLDRGTLSIFLARSRGPFALIWMTIRAIFQRPDKVADFESLTTTEARFTVHKRTVRVAVDGEVVMMTAPLHYRIRAGALRVIAPPAMAADASAPATDEPSAIASAVTS